MKKITLFALVALLAVACKNSGGEKQKKIDVLQAATEMKDSIINDIFASINFISENLDEIKARENIINSTSFGELRKETRARINEDIEAISELLEQNRKTIERLKGSTDNLRKANIKVREFDRLVAKLTKQIADKNADIAELNRELAGLNITVDRLNVSVETLAHGIDSLSLERMELEEALAAKELELNSVYYIIGREKDLIDEGILTKSGFIGRTPKVTETYDIGKFTRVGKDDIEEVLIGRKKAQIVTTHPAGSYELATGGGNTLEALKIKDPGKFWESSKILVISYK